MESNASCRYRQAANKGRHLVLVKSGNTEIVSTIAILLNTLIFMV
jgi:hypothetical protein